MTRTELLAFFDRQTAAAKALMSKKNQDYAEIDEVFGNLNACEHLNLCPSETGILIRMLDKYRRLCSLTKREAAVTTESFDDTCLDLINYVILLMARRSARTPALNPAPPQKFTEQIKFTKYVCEECGTMFESARIMLPGAIRCLTCTCKAAPDPSSVLLTYDPKKMVDAIKEAAPKPPSYTPCDTVDPCRSRICDLCKMPFKTTAPNYSAAVCDLCVRNMKSKPAVVPTDDPQWGGGKFGSR